MTVKVVPPTPYQVGSVDLINWHRVFKVPFDFLAGIGYVDGVETTPSHFVAYDIDVGDGERTIIGGSPAPEGIQAGVTPTTGRTWYAVSTSVDSGILYWSGVDANLDKIEGSVTLTGSTPIAIGGTDVSHINEVRYDGPANLGQIYVSTKSTAGTPAIFTDRVQCIIRNGDNVAFNPTILCPDGRVYVFDQLTASSYAPPSTENELEVKVYVKRFTDAQPALAARWYVGSGTTTIPFSVPFVLNPGDYATLRVRSVKNSNVALAIQTNRFELNSDINVVDTGDNQQGITRLFRNV